MSKINCHHSYNVASPL